MNSGLEQSIISTLVYFDIFDYPLTISEIKKWLYKDGAEIDVISNELDKLRDRGVIGVKNGFYFLRGREVIIQKRLTRYLLAQKKFKIALRIAKLFRWIPFIKLIAVCNDLAYSNAPEKSDIDMAIITSQKRIWMTRFISVFLLKILGLRPAALETKDKICLSFFAAENNLNFENLMINSEDIHFVYWLAQFVPIYNRDQTWQKFIQNNQWLRDYLPSWQPYQTAPQRQVNPPPRPCFLFIDFLGVLATNLDERFYAWLQIKIMPKNLREMANKDTRVVINNQILKFHDKDNRKEVQKKFQERISSY